MNSRTKQNEIIVMLVASRIEMQMPGMPFTFEDVKPILDALDIEPTTWAMKNLHKNEAGMIEHVGPNQYRLTTAGKFATIPLGSHPWRRPT